MVVICAGCERPILDRFLLNVLDRAWHAKCVNCLDCGCGLTEKCFSREGKLYCREDFFRRFGTKCGGCAEGISPNDLVRRARNKVFHLKCFTCMVCRKQLSTGEELYVLDENKFICKDDYLNSKFPGSDGEENEGDLDHSMLEKLEEALSDKAPSLPDDDSRDCSSPLTNGNLHGADTNGAANSTPTATHANSIPSPTLSSCSSDCADNKIEQNNNEANNINNSASLTNDNSISDASVNNENKENTNNDSIKTESKDNSKTGETDVNGNGTNGTQTSGTKRRGPRTTIKAKQLETLKSAFAATPKPTRHIREQLAQETGLNMRVIQVWFQNRRSKERRMKQLSALGARRQFFRNPRSRLRALGPGEDNGPEMIGQPGFNYFGDNGDFYPGYPGPGFHGDYFPTQPGDLPGPNMNFLPPSSGPQGASPLVDQSIPQGAQMVPGPESHQFMPNDMGLPPNNSSPEPTLPPMHHPDNPFSGGNLPPRSITQLSGYTQSLSHPQHEMATEAW